MLKNKKESFSASESLHQRIREHSWRIREHNSAKRTLGILLSINWAKG
jgi:hypothetical protein